MRALDFGSIIEQTGNVADLNYEDKNESETCQDKPDRDLTLESRSHYLNYLLARLRCESSRPIQVYCPPAI
jgi:hypothetical protein